MQEFYGVIGARWAQGGRKVSARRARGERKVGTSTMGSS